MFAAGADQEYVASQVGHEDITTTNRIYRYVFRRKARGQIGERRRQLLRTPPITREPAFEAVVSAPETAGEWANKGIQRQNERTPRCTTPPQLQQKGRKASFAGIPSGETGT